MFESLSQRLDKTLKNLRGLGRISEDNIKETLRDIRVSLLEADVALPVIQAFLEEVKTKALGQEVMQSLTPGQALIKIIKDEITQILGEENQELDLKATPPVVILVAGLQGSGKTTTVAKLAKHLQEKHKKSVMLTSADVYRPAAIQQLETLARDINAQYHPSDASQKPAKIAKAAIKAAKNAVCDILIFDTAGRLHVDDAMMDEIKNLHDILNPTETLFVVDSMTGQDAANTAKAFNDALPLTGVVLTKTDGDARGGAALSIRHITGKPIKFMGVGEKLDALEPFHPDRVASRILGMGDMLSLIEDVEQKVDKQKSKKLARQLAKGKSFDLEDFRDQLEQIGKLGSLKGLMKKIPGMGNIPGMGSGEDLEKKLSQIRAMINSMTPQERHFPALIKSSRKQRIANGSGTTVIDVNKLLKQFAQMQKMMKKFSSKGGLKKMMRGMGGMPGMGNMDLSSLMGGGGMPDMDKLSSMLPPGMKLPDDDD
ncbi:MAG: signal recognition particle protein [Gammaproteobacteria bacterium]